MANPDLATRGRLQNYLSTEQIRLLGEPSPGRVVIDIALTWVAVLAALTLYAYYPTIIVFIACFIFISSRQLAMTHLVHDASHYRLFKSRRLNDLASDLVLAGPVLISTESYRVQHLPHHQHLGDRALDSDQRTWYSLKGWNFLKRTVLTLLGWEAFVTFLSYADASSAQASGSVKGLIWRLACTLPGNALLLGYCWLLGNVYLYLLLWLLPMFTLTMYLLILRVIAEHQTIEYARRGEDRSGESFEHPLIRTVTPGPLGKLLLGPMNFFYHHEHHLAPSVPYTQLPKFHQLLVDSGYYRDYPESLGSSYYATLKQLVFPPQGLATDA
jgi:fatty acid desaturase